MEKRFRDLDEQVSILRRRGMETDARTRQVLLREGYYAVINGYRKPFLDTAATARAHEDRFLAGTSFEDVYALFRFDRELRAITFRHLMAVESLMRSVLSYTFCEHHPAVESYLDRNSYCTEQAYIRRREEHAGDLDWMIRTLEHHARGIAGDDPHVGKDVRVAHYRDKYSYVPLWVLFDELTFGNLKYFYALMRRPEQQEVCRRVWEACGREGASPLTRLGLAEDLEEMIGVRNICAHEERLFDYQGRTDDEGKARGSGAGHESGCGYLRFLSVLADYLTPQDEDRLRAEVRDLVAAYASADPQVAGALEPFTSGLGIG